MMIETPRIESAAMKTALIVDDHPLFCEALTITLTGALNFDRTEAAETLEAAIARLEQGDPPDVVLLDLNLPDVTGLDGLIRMRKTAPDVPVVVVSSMKDEKIMALSFRAGAAGYVPKNSRPEVFRKALATVAAGGVFAPEGAEGALTGAAPETERDDAVRRLSQLTLQQARILKLVCEGQLNKQIAYNLSIAETTVKTHMTAILRKLGAHSRTQAVLIAQEANFAKLLQDSGEND